MRRGIEPREGLLHAEDTTRSRRFVQPLPMPMEKSPDVAHEEIHKRAQSILPLIVLVVREVANIIDAPNEVGAITAVGGGVRHGLWQLKGPFRDLPM